MGDRVLVATKGAPESVLPLCSRAVTAQAPDVPLDAPLSRAVLATAAQLAAGGARLLALADRSMGRLPADPAEAERDLTLLGLVALADPLRPEAPASVAHARSAGVTPLMATGDHAGTATSVAAAISLLRNGDPVMTGDDLQRDGVPVDPAGVAV